MKTFAIAMLWLFVYKSVIAQPRLEGNWRGGLNSGNSWLDISLHFKPVADTIQGTIDIPAFGLQTQPLQKIRLDGSKIYFEWPRPVGTGIFEGEWTDAGFSCKYTRGPVNSVFTLVKQVPV